MREDDLCQMTTFDDDHIGGYHGAEVCDLVGLYLLSQLSQVLPKGLVGLYRDDGLAVSAATKRQNENLKKDICKIFTQNGLNITIETNMKVVNFLDVTLDLNTGEFKPFMKENDNPVYVDVLKEVEQNFFIKRDI